MYYQHFGLNGPPFQFNVSPSALYRGREHSEAWAALEWGLLYDPTGYSLLIGEPGTGKTTLVGALLVQHYHQVIAAYLNHPRLPVRDLLRLALRQLGIDPAPETKADCLEAFRAIVRSAASGRHVAVVVDEAQELSTDAFEELRLLAEYVQIDGSQLRLAFVGQPTLLELVGSPALRHLDQRIGTRARLNALDSTEAYHYIEHRLRACHSSSGRIFAPAALRELVVRGRGIPRRINVIGHNSMLAAYSAGAHRVRRSDVLDAARDYENLRSSSRPAAPSNGGRPAPKRWKFWRLIRPAMAVALLALVGLGLAQLWLRSRAAAAPLRSTPLGALEHQGHRAG